MRKRKAKLLVVEEKFPSVKNSVMTSAALPSGIQAPKPLKDHRKVYRKKYFGDEENGDCAILRYGSVILGNEW